LPLPRGLGVERVGVRGTPSSLCVQRIASSAYEKLLSSFCCEKNWNFLFVDRQFVFRFFSREREFEDRVF
jgi:hypothetical protein